MAAFNSMELCLIFLLLFLLSFIFPSYVSSENSKYEACSKKLQSCGSIVQEIGYPFYDGSTRPDYCGHPGFKLDCLQGTQQINISDQAYKLVKIDTKSIVVSRTDNWGGGCPNSLVNTTMDLSKFSFTSSDQNVTFFYNCGSTTTNLLLIGNCNLGGSQFTGYYLTLAMMDQYKDLWQDCKSSLFLPILESEAESVTEDRTWVTLNKAFSSGFELGVITDIVNTCNSCTESDGECGYNWNSNKFVCHCADADYDRSCGVASPPAQGPKKVVLIIASSVGIGLVMLGFLILFSFFVFRKCKPPKAKYAQGKSNRPALKNQRVEDMLKNYESLGPRRYTYANIAKMTNSFREKLGEGGYGTVFKGKLEDGRAVAVKVWKQCKGGGHEFANEVVSIGSTSHINVVPLLGFCFEGPKGALIYEFMPNGSLEKFIRRRDVNMNDRALPFQKLFEIAVGIARGLEYLHRDCNTRIVHFDIKPHNILLDAEFTPKISDFGLAKAFKKQESIISISGARGTAGYIAPEVFFSSFGGVTHKSDVYSYGMMVLEMVGCTKRTSENVENSSELYFPRWIYKQLERETTLDCAERVLNDEDKELERKMVLVGLWCIQTNPMSRPSICRVLAMLEGEAELVVPPMPSFASPPRQQQSMGDGSSTFLSSDTYVSSNNPEISVCKVHM